MTTRSLRIREVPNDVAARRAETLLLAGSSYAARWIHHEKDAKDRIDAAFRLLNETKDYPAESIRAGSEADTAMRALADHYAETGQPEQALEIYQELFRKIMASNPDPQNDLLNSVYVSRLHTSLAMLLRRAGRGNEAVPLEADRSRALAALESQAPRQSVCTAATRSSLVGQVANRRKRRVVNLRSSYFPSSTRSACILSAVCHQLPPRIPC